MLAYKISECEVCIIWRKPTEALKNPSPIAESRTGKPAKGHTKDTTRLFHGPLHDPVGEHICAQPFRMLNRLCFHPVFFRFSLIFQWRKNDANKQDFEIKLNLTCVFNHAIIWTNAGILLIGPVGTNFSEILIEIYTFSFKKMQLKMLSGKWWPFCLGLNVLIISTSPVK